MFNDESVCGEAFAKVDGQWATTILKRVRRASMAAFGFAFTSTITRFSWKTTLADCACQTTPHHP
jgi:hypothetical protein